MEKLIETGKARAIVISNFSKAEVETLLREGSIVPAAHQMECRPWLQQNDFTEWQKSKGIHIEQYSPFGNQNEIYDSGKDMGKLMVRTSHTTQLPTPLRLKEISNSYTDYSAYIQDDPARSARSATKAAHKSRSHGASRRATPCCQNPRRRRA